MRGAALAVDEPGVAQVTPADSTGTEWTRVEIAHIEGLSDAVYGAGLDAIQMSRAPLSGSLCFAVIEGVIYSSGSLGGRVALRGPLSEQMITFGVGLRLCSGSRHWLNEVTTGDFGVFLPGDDHDALYAPGALYATVTLDAERLDTVAAQFGLVVDKRQLGGTRIHEQRVSEPTLEALRTGFERLHVGSASSAPAAASLRRDLLVAAVTHISRPPRRQVGRTDPRARARIVVRARAYVQEKLEEPVSIDAMARAASTSHRTLHRAFVEVLGETPQSYVRKLRLHRIRRDLASEAEFASTVALIANRWGFTELGRMSAYYRELFGERPSETLARGHAG